MNQAIDYIQSFLLYHNEHAQKVVGYTNDTKLFKNYKVVILPSGFFESETYGTPASEPNLPLQYIEDVPLLYGSPKIEQIGTTLVVSADIIASTFFLITRYEEWIHPTGSRDQHGRFIGKESLPARAGFIERPIVDEYAALLRGWLSKAGVEVQPIENSFSDILLTHDVDTIEHYRHLRGFLGGLKRMFTPSGPSLIKLFKSVRSLENDPAYTFPWLLEQDRKVAQSHSLFFIKATKKNNIFDRPLYKLNGKDAKQLLSFIDQQYVFIGLHSSYVAGQRPKLIGKELRRLQRKSHVVIRRVRSHYLRSLQPHDFKILIKNGITDDFSMGYADIAGFRLGTCRSVKWIDPKTLKITSLTLHPLTVMDVTLTNPDYMGLSNDEAYQYVTKLIDATRHYNGELVLLWHNTTVEKGVSDKARLLYQQIIAYIQ